MPQLTSIRQRFAVVRPGPAISLVIFALSLAGCLKLGPDFVRPETPLATNWMGADNGQITNEPVNYRDWWRVFDDPVLDRLIDTAYRENLSLKIAGVRVLEARAQLGIATSQLFPQTRQAFGSLSYSRTSEHSTLSSFGSSPGAYTQDEVGFNAIWEIDFWGKFRRGIESADAVLLGTIADYDSALVTLTADVATSYILLMTLGKRIEFARRNVAAQQEALKIAEIKREGGTATQRDVEQALTILSNTTAFVSTLETQLRQAHNGLAVLLGGPPNTEPGLLSGKFVIPVPPARIVAGIPIDLLRRRPDIRSAEYQARAQGAQIGVAKADLFPAFSLSGTFSFLSTDTGISRLRDVFRWSSRQYTAGSGAQWSIFNYGRIMNNIRVQDARFQQLLLAYENSVLKAQQEVENGLVSFVRGQEAAHNLAQSAEAAKRSFDLSLAQYREGATDFTTVLTAQQALLNAQDSLAATAGSLATSVVDVYRALGGGWQIREGEELIPENLKKMMAKRTDWGDLLETVPLLPDSEAGVGSINPTH